MTTTERTKPQQAHGRVSSERFHEAVPSTTIPQRIRATARQQAKEIGLAVARRAPRVGRVLERARTQPLRSSAVRMYQWWKAPYGTASKPASLGEIPWDYVESNQDTIPFRGLREYWYPALESRQLHHNEPQPVTLLGDNLVFFRTADGSPSALENRCPHRSALPFNGPI